MYHDDYSEQELAKLERKLQRIYRSAKKELNQKASDYFRQFEDRYNGEYLKYQDGKLTKMEFENWVNAQVGRGKRWEALRDQMSERITDANKIAADYINNVTPKVYAENYNYAAYTIEQVGDDISFTLLDENTVRHLSESQKDLLPKAGVNIPKDQKWNQKKLQNALLQGILMGDSIGDLAGRLESVANMNRNSAIRNARTMVTGAQNGGRQKSYEEAEAMGIKIQKEWMSAKDNRVRDSHAQLNGVRVRYNKPFPNGCRYPGDPSGRPEEVYNCRCTMVAITPNASQKKRTKNTAASYKRWKQEKETLQKAGGIVDNVLTKPIETADEHFKLIFELTGKDGVSYNPVKMQKQQPTVEEIIDKISGGDKTGGSCASLGLAYIGQKHGFDVLDFRGGASRGFFADLSHINEWIASDKFTTEVLRGTGACSATIGLNLLKQCEVGKEYYLGVGRHAAIVRKIDDGTKKGKYQYLELQSEKKEENGWTDFAENTRYTLMNRFKCSKMSNRYHQRYALMIDVDDEGFKTDEFRSLLGYLNTNEDEQMKGKTGHVK